MDYEPTVSIYNFPVVLTLLLVALKLDGYIDPSWSFVLFVPMVVSNFIAAVCGVITSHGERKRTRSGLKYGEPLYWDNENKKMYGPFEQDDGR